MVNDYKIAFIGGTKRGYELLKLLFEKKFKKICYICGMLEDPHEVEKYSVEIEKLARGNNKPFKICKKLNNKDIEDILVTRPDIVLIVGWRTLIDSNLYQYPKYGAWAAHDSLLPKYRGFAPLNWAIINGEKQTGVTLFKVDKGMDTGPIIMQKAVQIKNTDTVKDIYERVIQATIDVVFKALDLLEKGKLKLVPQNNSKATYTCPRTPSDGYIDWTKSAYEIDRFIKALSPPYPCAFSFYKGKPLKIISSELPKKTLKYVGNIPGRPIKIYKGVGVEVLTGKGSIIIKEIITEEGAIVTADKLITSIRTTLGLSLVDLYNLILTKNG